MDGRSPDGRPRARQIPAIDRSYQSELRSALALLSSGSSGLSRGNADTVCGIQVESPEPRVLRVAYGLDADSRALGAGNPTLVEVAEGMDAASIVRTYIAPLQGLAIGVPAGVTRVTVTSNAALAYQLSPVETRVYASLSCGVLASRWYTDAFAAQQTVTLYPTATDVVAPVFATTARVTVLTGSLAEPVTGSPVWLPGAQVQLAPNVYGLLKLYAGSPNTSVAIEWRVHE
jgi:hypothetical protein